MKLLITGGSGTLGQLIVSNFRQEVDQIVTLDNFSTGSKPPLAEHKSVLDLEGDVSNISDLRRAFERSSPTHVIHLAASYKDPKKQIEDITTNVVGTYNLIELCKEFGVSHVINVQTVLCYGNPIRTPIEESHPLQPSNSYSITKVSAEELIKASNVPFTSLRLASVIGPGLRIGPVPAFYKKLSEGDSVTVTDSIRDFLHFEDFLGLLRLVLFNEPSGRSVNVGSGSGTKILELLEIVSEYLGVQPNFTMEPPSPDDVSEIVLDISLAREIYGWSPTLSIESAIERCLSEYKSNGLTDIYSHLLPKE